MHSSNFKKPIKITSFKSKKNPLTIEDVISINSDETNFRSHSRQSSCNIFNNVFYF